MLTYFRARYRLTPQDPVPYRLNEQFVHPLNRDYLVTTRHRAWAILEPREMHLLAAGRLHEDPRLFTLLADLGIILTADNLEAVAGMYAARYRFLHLPPSLFIVVPTGRCNLRCDYCHARSGGPGDPGLDMDLGTARQAVDLFFAAPRLQDEVRIEFQGGEPLLRYDLVQAIMDYAGKCGEETGVKVGGTIVTNLLAMTDDIAADVRQRGLSLCTSLDGPADCHNAQRRTAGGEPSYDTVVYWLRRLKEDYGLSVPSICTLTRVHAGRGRDVVGHFLNLGLPAYARPMNAVGRGLNNPAVVPGPDEVMDIWDEVIDAAIEACRGGRELIERQTQSVLGGMLSPGYSFMCIRRPCGCAVSQIVVDYDGRVIGCDQGRTNDLLSLGHVSSLNYDDLVRSAEGRIARALVPETLPGCETCPFEAYCGICLVRATLQHGGPQLDLVRDHECRLYRRLIPSLFRRLKDPRQAAVLLRWA